MNSERLLRITTSVAAGIASCSLPLSMALRPATIPGRSVVVEAAIVTSSAAYWALSRAHQRMPAPAGVAAS